MLRAGSGRLLKSDMMSWQFADGRCLRCEGYGKHKKGILKVPVAKGVLSEVSLPYSKVSQLQRD